jgi:hypothetical protein
VNNATTKHFANSGGIVGSDEVWFNSTRAAGATTQARDMHKLGPFYRRLSKM